MLQRKTQKRAPHKVIILQKKVIIFFAKMQFFALFALDFPHLGFRFWPPKTAQYKGISELQF